MTMKMNKKCLNFIKHCYQLVYELAAKFLRKLRKYLQSLFDNQSRSFSLVELWTSEIYVFHSKLIVGELLLDSEFHELFRP